MSGADFFIIIVVAILTWVGATRGVIKEFFELMIVTLDVLLCTHLYGPLSDLLVKAKLPVMTASTISYLFLFLLIAFTLWVVAGKAEASANIPPRNGGNQFGGALMAFVKSCILIWALLFMISTIPMTDNGKAFFAGSFCVRTLESLNPVVDQAFYAAGSERTYRWLHPRIKKFRF